jgi:signal transduction histidine kinase/ActR/RegA family two-component response regulator
VTAGTQATLEQRVLFLAPTGKDAAMTVSILSRAGIPCVSCSSLSEVCDELERGAGVIMVPEEEVMIERYSCLAEWLGRQPAWSDLPVLILARPGADSATVAQAMDKLGNVTVLERPTRVASLVSAARTALRARQRQYQIREYLSELIRNEEALRSADRRKDEFLAILAHELRNPLAPIRNSLHILRLATPQDAIASRATEMMERQVSHMVRLVDDLLEVSRISRGKIDLRRELTDVSSVVRSALETSGPLIDAAGQHLVLEFPREPLQLHGDVVRLTQVVANLLNNASKYSEAGGRIWLTVRREGDSAVIAVRDTGRGIPPDQLARVFDPFVQIEHQPNRAKGGLGIGLTLVKRLVELHGGTVEARSEGPGRGSEFIVQLPLAAGLTAEAPAEAPADSPALGRRRVLVVDDNRDAAESLGMVLELLGAEVFIASSGPEALDNLVARQPTVVLLDIGMPGMDGFEVARRIRQQPRFHHVTLIALTGWGQEGDRRLSQAAGFDHHLIKPADIQTLQGLLATIDDHRPRSELLR